MTALKASGLPPSNKLFYGDNLDVLRVMTSASVDLVYLDPPFNSNREYNAIFRDESGNKSDAQIRAFTDTWSWGPTPELHLTFLTNSALHRGAVPDSLAQLVGAFTFALGKTPILAYLVEMAVRLVELRRVLKPAGSLYLHCDPTASHYLKLILDALFGTENFRGEIHWKRTSSHNDSKRWPQIHDTLLFYAGSGFTWNPVYLDHDLDYVDKFYRFTDSRGRYRLHEVIRTASMGPRPNLAYEYKGYTPEWGWRVIRSKLEVLDSEGRVEWGKSGRPYLRRYLAEQEGTLASSLWVDIPPLSAAAAEKVGYPTQKPLALLERIISASSNPGDVVLDPFCGCGTAVVAAQKLNRRWIGIDITYLAIAIMRARLHAGFPGMGPIQIENRPTEYEGARRMATETPEGRYQFQWWALDEIGALPRTDDRRKGADQGIDGTITFSDANGELRTVVVSVKSGHPKLDDVRVLRAVVEREGAAIGVLVTLDEPTPQMRQDAAAAGLWHSDLYDTDYSRVQILTARDIIERKRRPDLPPLIAAPYRTPGRVAATPTDEQVSLNLP